MPEQTSASQLGQPVFTITYWGVTGTLTAPLRPPEVTDKVVGAITRLAERGRLADLRPGPGLEAEVRRLVEAELPFHLRSSYGGNTTCVEVQTPDALIILDCGSGFRELGIALEARWKVAPRDGGKGGRTAHVLVSHPHIDHIYATPYFAPYFDPANRFIIWGSAGVLESLGVLFNPTSELSQTYFPPTYDQMKALEDFRPVQAGAEFRIGSTRITTHALYHPGGCMAYRLENAGRVFVFATDNEHIEVPDPGLAAFARDADVLYTEGQYTAAEYEGCEGIGGDPPLSRRGWGHSSIEACLATALAAGVRELHIGHRDPRRSDEQLAHLDASLRQLARDELRRAGRPEDDCRARIVHEGLVVRY
jgi:phosphoribosyl 1,2-cyclic phosphodiesterase